MFNVINVAWFESKSSRTVDDVGFIETIPPPWRRDIFPGKRDQKAESVSRL